MDGSESPNERRSEECVCWCDGEFIPLSCKETGSKYCLAKGMLHSDTYHKYPK